MKKISTVKKIVVISIAIIIGFILGKTLLFQGNSSIRTNIFNDIQYKELINDMEGSPFNAYVFYESINDLGGNEKVYQIHNGKVELSKDIYRSTYSNVYAEKAVNILVKELGLKDSVYNMFGQLYFYEKTEEYELMVFDNFVNENTEWTVFARNNKNVHLEKITFEKSEESKELLDSFQIVGNTLYLFTRSENSTSSDLIIYDIPIDGSYDENKHVTTIPIEKFENKEFIIEYGKIFIQDSKLILWAESRNNSAINYIYEYDMFKKTMNKKEIDGNISKLSPYKEGFLCLHTKNRELYIDILTKSLDIVSTKLVKIKKDKGLQPELLNLDRYYYLKNYKLYGTLSVDGKKEPNYITIIDIEEAELKYLGRLEGIPDGYSKIFTWFCPEDSAYIWNLY